jgi:uncharacterized cupin superfamily protein
MDLGYGVHVSRLTTGDWEPDPDVGGEMHHLCNVDGVEAGLSRYAKEPAEPIKYTLPERETLLVLEGEARIEITDGPTLNLKAGDLASLPKGAETTWYLRAPYREFWVFS